MNSGGSGGSSSILHLNVGGERFSTSKQTLTWIPESFFASLLSGRIPTVKDETGAIFIDRDPQLFKVILNYLRTKHVDFSSVSLGALKHEAQYYGLAPLVKRLMLCDELNQCECGDVLFHGYLPPPPIPMAEDAEHHGTTHHQISPLPRGSGHSGMQSPSQRGLIGPTVGGVGGGWSHSRNLSEPPVLPSRLHSYPGTSGNGPRPLPSTEPKFQVPSLPEGEENLGGLRGASGVSRGQSSLRGTASTSASVPANQDNMEETSTGLKKGGANGFDGWKEGTSVGESAADQFGSSSSPATSKGHLCAANADESRPSHNQTSRSSSQMASSTNWHNRASSADYLKIAMPSAMNTGYGGMGTGGGGRNYPGGGGHKRVSSDIGRLLKADLSHILRQHQSQQKNMNMDPFRVRLIRGHHNWVAAGYVHFVCCYRMKDSIGWQLAYVTPRMESEVRHIALNAKFGNQSSDKMLAAALNNQSIHLWTLGEDTGGEAKIGVFSLSVPIDTLFFIGNQLVALSKTGKVGIWHSMTQNWQVQDVLPISSYDTAGSFLLLGCTNGSIYYIDMQKFPLRMKDNDLLVTELYRDPSADVITSISVYLTPKTNLCGNWIEIAYGTSAGAVRVIVQHPETVGHGPQLFQTFSVHRAPITNVALTTNHLMAVCSEYNHVRSWGVTRFRGMISTQPGSTPLASFKVLTLESVDWNLDYDAPDVGPFGDQDGEQVFVQKIVPDTDQLFIRLASNGDRVCVIKSVDRSCISSYLVHECEGSSRMGSRPRRYLFTGHTNGSIQMWDLTTALDMYQNGKEKGTVGGEGGPTPEELLQLIDECEITCNSLNSTPCVTPAASINHLPGLFQK